MAAIGQTNGKAGPLSQQRSEVDMRVGQHDDIARPALHGIVGGERRPAGRRRQVSRAEPWVASSSQRQLMQARGDRKLHQRCGARTTKITWTMGCDTSYAISASIGWDTSEIKTLSLPA